MIEARRLAAILAVDVVGYSRLMGEDEAGTARLVRDHRDAARPLIAQMGGRIVKTMGDGLLLEFPSVVSAVECAIAIQKLMVDRNAKMPPNKRTLYRIGVNLGDVLIDGDDILGDGVNIAARLEGVCEPGGILVSSSAYDHVRGKINANFIDVGEKELKNIARPVRAYSIDMTIKEEDRTVFQPSTSGPVRKGVRLNGIYEIEKLIGEGGMGEVYKGFSVETRDPVAIKMIRPDMSRNPDALALFRREASTLHTLLHEAIVRYYVFSVDPDLKRAYLAMEFVDGVSLSNKLATGPLPLADVWILKARIAGALETAHRLGVVHRDISSDNVILPKGDVRLAKVIDFGIARSHREGEGTIIGDGFAGKNKYASPEQLSGSPVTFKSDIYSFGLVLAEALRGSPIDMGGSTFEIVEKRRRVPDLSDIPLPIRPLIHSMLEPDPTDRPASMAAVAEWTEPPPKAVLKAPPPKPVAKSVERAPSSGKRLAGVGALIAVASIAATVFVFRDDLGEMVKPFFASSPPVVAVRPKPPTLTPATPLETTLPEPALATPTPTPTAVTEQSPTPTTEPKPAPIPPSAPTLTTTPPPPPANVANSASAGGTPTPPAKEGQGKQIMEEIVGIARIHAPASIMALPQAIVGKPYRSELPPFVDPTKQALKLELDAPPPDGLTFTDMGQGKGEISGSAAKPGTSAFHVTATNPQGHSAEMAVTLVIEAAPPPPPVAQVAAPTPAQPAVTLEGARLDQDFAADLPPFKVASNTRGVVLRADPNPPDGLALVDLGSGVGKIAGKPKQAGAFSFDVLAGHPEGPTGRMTVKMAIAPRLSVPTALSDKQGLFLARYEGGSCFLARAPNSADPMALQGLSADASAFPRFGAAYRRELGVDPKLTQQLIDGPECAVLDILRLAATGAVPPPRVELKSTEVGRGRPLAGTVSGLAGRVLKLIAVEDDGSADLIGDTIASGGGSAEFSVDLTVDAEDVGHTLAVLAIVSDKPFSALNQTRLGKANELMPKLIVEWADIGASADARFAKLVK